MNGVMNIPNYKEAKLRTKKEVKVLYDKYHVNEDIKKYFKGKLYYIETYGCQMNVHDSENIKAILEEIGFVETNDMNLSDLILLNTCAIRENAHNKVFGMLGRIKHLKETRKDIITCLCGCMAQEESVVNELKNRYKWVDIIFGTHNIYELPNLLSNIAQTRTQNINVYSIEGDIVENLPVKRDSKYKAWVNIMYGCDKFCTYCIVPFTRGSQRSRLPKDILNEVENLKKEGYLEITLLGQNVNAYGKDLNINYNMASLLEDVAKTNIPRIRFVTSHPWDFTDEMIEVIKNNPNIMPYIHLPLQSGSDRILKLMGRRYTKEKYLELFNKLKKALPYSSITTDIIVGFPGETEEDFNDTLDVVNECKFDSAFTFIFSPRIGTPAAKMKDDVSLETKNERLQKLNELINKYSKEANDRYLNKTVPVLIEGYSEKDNKYLMGYTDTMKLVNVEGSKENIGQIVNVKITDVKTWSMNGKIIK